MGIVKYFLDKIIMVSNRGLDLTDVSNLLHSGRTECLGEAGILC